MQSGLQEAVERLLQKEEALYSEPSQEMYDKEFFGFTYSNYGRLLSQSFSWLPKSATTVHPMPGLAARPISRHKLSPASLSGRSLSNRKLAAHSRTSSTHKLLVASSGSTSHTLIAASKSASSWLPGLLLRNNAVTPSLDVVQSQSEAKAYRRLAPSSSPWLSTETWQPHRVVSAGPTFEHETMLQQHDREPGMSPVGLPRTKSILHSKSSLTAVSLFDAGLSMSSSDDDGSLAVPEDLTDSAMFLLRDATLADPQAEVSQHAGRMKICPALCLADCIVTCLASSVQEAIQRETCAGCD